MLQQCFSQAKAYVAVLQAAAIELKRRHELTDQDRKQLVQVLRSLQQLHKLVTSLLAQIQQAHGEVQDLTCDGLSRDIADPAVDHFLQQRQSALKKEAADNQQAAILLGLDQQACFTLAQVVAQLRSIESSVVFQALLQQQVAAVSGAAGYSSDNFAYNSTPFASWAKVHSHPQLAAAMEAARCHQPSGSGPGASKCSCRNSSKVYMVWGSSIGWLALYAGLAYGRSWRVVGVDLLPGPVQVAQQVADSAGLREVSFVCADLLETDLTDVGVLFLTEQCWDQQLIRQCCAKLQRELPDGAVVVDYTGAMGREGLSSRLEVVIEVSVGWNDRQQMHAYVRDASRFPTAPVEGNVQ